MLKSCHKPREECRKGMKQRIKDQIRTKLTTEIVNLADIDKREEVGCEECCQERLWQRLRRERRKERNDFMLKEGDGCDPAVSHVPCGVLGGPAASRAYFFLLVLSSLAGLLHSCPLLSFNIWSLFSISNTRAPAMTPLLKMPRIRISSEGKKELTFNERVRLQVFSCISNSPFPVVSHYVSLRLSSLHLLQISSNLKQLNHVWLNALTF